MPAVDDIEQHLESFAQNNVDSNAIMAQLEAPAPQATLVANTSMPNQDTSQSEAAKRSKAYRDRVKKHKTEMEGNMKALTQENKALKVEVGALKAENSRLNQDSQCQREVIDKLTHDLNRLMPEHKKQYVLVKILSEKLAVSDPNPRGEEVQKLKNEIDLLRQGMGMDSPCLELMKEIAKLKHELEKVKHEKRALEVQCDALCGKIIAENPSP
ncbi:hypothetical protein SLEP1_g33047 [Rubroshorea leprosula]|uniref:BZIP domain-containing protein n=1 Tax=Rubroshorea leprosula TaxID=152421 RepID=A0AAV5KFE5_9ROSI|nr:hypothetical protein SLEP1_g33047 [Rubroshorea leprosula]